MIRRILLLVVIGAIFLVGYKIFMQPKNHAENVVLSGFVNTGDNLVNTSGSNSGIDLLSDQEVQKVEIIDQKTGQVVEATGSVSNELSEQDERDLKKILDSLIEE